MSSGRRSTGPKPCAVLEGLTHSLAWDRSSVSNHLPVHLDRIRSEASLETSLSDPLLHDRTTFREQSLNKVDWLIGAFLLVAVFISKAAVLDLPYHWDEIGYASSTHWLISEGLWRILPGTYPPTTFFGHPPGLFFSLAGL